MIFRRSELAGIIEKWETEEEEERRRKDTEKGGKEKGNIEERKKSRGKSSLKEDGSTMEEKKKSFPSLFSLSLCPPFFLGVTFSPKNVSALVYVIVPVCLQVCLSVSECFCSPLGISHSLTICFTILEPLRRISMQFRNVDRMIIGHWNRGNVGSG